MTDTIDNFNSATAVVRQRAQGAGYRRAVSEVFNLGAAFRARGVTFGSGMDGAEN